MMRRGVMVVLLLLLAAAAGWAVPFDGTMLVTATGDMGDYAYYLEGDTANVVAAPAKMRYGMMARQLDRVAYFLQDAYPVTACDIWTADLDGGNAINITGALGGVNCHPDWSPDGSEIAFQRAVPHDGIPPCLVGFEIWVMNADGSNARRISPLGAWIQGPSWSVDGFRIACHDTDGPSAHLVDKDGTDWSTPPDLGGEAQWSPDGISIASVTYYYGDESGPPGVWRGLILTDTAGANPVIVREQFIPDSTLLTYLAENGGVPTDPTELEYALRGLRVGIGPCSPQWSPRGDQILFRETVAFDPHGITYWRQAELWLYDLPSRTFTEITNNRDAEASISWGGYNTKPDQTTVTVGAVTITFDQVLEPGVTVVLRDDDPPEIAGQMLFDGSYYELCTTATVTGPVTVCMTYTDAAVPPGPAEDGLAILHWDGAEWIDATTAHDPDVNLICAEMDSLSPVALYGERKARFSDVPAWGYGDDGLSPSWAYYAVQACADGGVVSGYVGGAYQPGWSVTRDQMAAYIARAVAGNDGNIPPFTGAPRFADVPANYWALKHIEYAATQGIVKGYEDGYHPLEPVSRGQLAAYVARARGWVGDEALNTADQLFSDVPAGYWSGAAIAACMEYGAVKGYADGSYQPEKIVTRDQMAVYVARAFGL